MQSGECSVQTICTKCREDQEQNGIHPKNVVDTVYIGETSRTLGIRSAQHRKDYSRPRTINNTREGNDETSSFMWDYRLDKHADNTIDVKTNFKFEVIDTFRDPLSRQITEAVRIKQAMKSNIFQNNKGETYQIVNLNRKMEVFAPRERFNY